MTTRKDCRSIFDLCLNDEASGLREVNPVLKEGVIIDLASDCMYGTHMMLWGKRCPVYSVVE